MLDSHHRIIFIILFGALLLGGFSISSQAKVRQVPLSGEKCVIIKSINLGGDTLVFPQGVIVHFRRGVISNGHIRFNENRIKAKEKRIFDNVTTEGSILNDEIIVKWFGCSPKTFDKDNFTILKYTILPLAIRSKANVFHSEKGTYKIWGQYPIYESSWKADHTFIRDFRGIAIHGTGHKTVIKATKYTDGKNPSDVFCLVDLKNLTIRDLGITADHVTNDPSVSGTNGVSLNETVENVTIENCFIFHLPSNYASEHITVDGGHGITIQAADKNTIQRNIYVYKNLIRDVSLGLDFSKGELGATGIVDNVVFDNNTVEDSYVGFYSHGFHEDALKGSLVTNNLFKNCQYGIYGYALQGFVFSHNNILTTKRVIKDTKITSDSYGVLMYGPKDIKLIDNTINIENGASSITIDIVSENPKYNGYVENVEIRGNLIKGRKGANNSLIKDERFVKGLIIDDINF